MSGLLRRTYQVDPTGDPSVDVPAIREALARAASSGGDVVLGPGTFAVGPFGDDIGRILVPSNTRMRGQGIGRTTLLSTVVATGDNADTPLATFPDPVLVVSESLLDAANIFGSDEVWLTAPVSGSLTVGHFLLLRGTINTFVGGTYEIRAIAGAGPYIVTVDRPVNFQFQAGDHYYTRSTWTHHIEVSDFTLTGTGSRLFEFEGTRECIARRIKFVPTVCTSADWTVSYDSYGYRNLFIECEFDGGLANAGMAFEQNDSSAAIDCHVHHSLMYGIGVTNGCNVEIVRPRVHDCFNWGIVSRPEVGGSPGNYQFSVLGGEVYNCGASAQVTGSVNLNALAYGGGGTLDGKTMTIGVDQGHADVVVAFGTPANAAAVVASISAALGATIASLDGSGHLVLRSTRYGVLSQVRLPDYPATVTESVGFTRGMFFASTLTGGIWLSEVQQANIRTNSHHNSLNVRCDTGTTADVAGNLTDAPNKGVLVADSTVVFGAIDTSRSGQGLDLATSTVSIAHWTHSSSGIGGLDYTAAANVNACMVRICRSKIDLLTFAQLAISLVGGASDIWLDNFEWASSVNWSYGISNNSTTSRIHLAHGTIVGFPGGGPLIRSAGTIFIGEGVDLGANAAVSDIEPYEQNPQSALSTIAMGDAAKVLTVAQAQAGVIACTGALTADRNLQLPKVAGYLWTINNQTTGGHNVLAIASSGTGVNCAFGISRVYFDGTNMVSA